MIPIKRQVEDFNLIILMAVHRVISASIADEELSNLIGISIKHREIFKDFNNN